MSAPSSGRTVVFIDYQNMYRSAREAFGWEAQPGQFGNFRESRSDMSKQVDPERWKRIRRRY